MISANAATLAGTPIRNIAEVQYGLGGQTATIHSNLVSTRVDEIIDFSVDALPIPTTTTRHGLLAVGFKILNRGNGVESFVIGTPVATGNFRVLGLAEDSNGNGVYDEDVDRAIQPGSSTPDLAPGQSYTVFVLGEGSLDDSTLELPVTSRLGDGKVGSVVVGGGDGGSDAVIGGSGGIVHGRPVLKRVTTVEAELVKTQTIVARDGSATPMRGALITYTLEGRFTGGGTASSVVIADPIPTGAAYVAGSLKLDGAALSDAADGDTGRFDGSGISVALGDVPAPATHIVSFQVRIQ